MNEGVERSCRLSLIFILKDCEYFQLCMKIKINLKLIKINYCIKIKIKYLSTYSEIFATLSKISNFKSFRFKSSTS